MYPKAYFTDADPWKILSDGRTLPVSLRSCLSKLSPHLSNSACASAFLLNNFQDLNQSLGLYCLKMLTGKSVHINSVTPQAVDTNITSRENCENYCHLRATDKYVDKV